MLMLSRIKSVVSISQSGKHTRRFPAASFQTAMQSLFAFPPGTRPAGNGVRTGYTSSSASLSSSSDRPIRSRMRDTAASAREMTWRIKQQMLRAIAAFLQSFISEAGKHTVSPSTPPFQFDSFDSFHAYHAASVRLQSGFHVAGLSIQTLSMGIVPSFNAVVYAKTDTSYEICVKAPMAGSC